MSRKRISSAQTRSASTRLHDPDQITPAQQIRELPGIGDRLISEAVVYARSSAALNRENAGRCGAFGEIYQGINQGSAVVPSGMFQPFIPGESRDLLQHSSRCSRPWSARSWKSSMASRSWRSGTAGATPRPSTGDGRPDCSTTCLNAAMRPCSTPESGRPAGAAPRGLHGPGDRGSRLV
jgi:hypothetical protein